MRLRSAKAILLLGLGVAVSAPAVADDKDKTIESLEEKTVEVRPGKVIIHSTELARDNYKAFLELSTDDPDQRAEAMRRLGDLELDATEAAQLAENLETLDLEGYNSAVEMYEQVLREHPEYARNDTIMYQLARAYPMTVKTGEI